MNNYIKVLSYLKQYEGDAKYHNLENVFDLDKDTLKAVLIKLRDHKFMLLKGGYHNTDAVVAFGYGNGRVKTLYPPHEVYFPFEGQITFEGSKYLKEEMKSSKKSSPSKFNLKAGKNANVNVIFNSANSTIQSNPELASKLEKIIEVLEQDKQIDKQRQNEAIQVFSQLKTEQEGGTITKATVTKAMELGSNISSIGSLVLSVIQMLSITPSP